MPRHKPRDHFRLLTKAPSDEAMMLTEEYAITRDDAGEKEDSARLAEELQSQVRKEREKRKQAQRERAKGKRMKTTEQVDRLPKETLSAADCVRGAADTRSAEDWALVRVRRIIGQGVVELVWKDGCVSVHDSPEVLQNAPLKILHFYEALYLYRLTEEEAPSK